MKENNDGRIELINEPLDNYLKYRVQQQRSLLGRKPEAIQEFMQKEQENMNLSLKKMQENLRGDVTYFGSVSVNFIVCRGHVTATVTFGDNNEWEFSSDFWGGGAGSSTGAGISVWGDGFIAPQQNEKMSFELSTAGFTAGEIQMFWWRPNGPIIGSILAVGASIGIAGGGGEGYWKKK